MSDDQSDDTDGYTSIAELDDAVAAGRISFDRYWTVRAALDDKAAVEREEQMYDPAPVVPEPHWIAPSFDYDVVPGFVSPPPNPPRAAVLPHSPTPMVPPPPAAGWQPGGPVTLGGSVPSAEAGATRADDRGRRRRRRGRRAR